MERILGKRQLNEGAVTLGGPNDALHRFKRLDSVVGDVEVRDARRIFEESADEITSVRREFVGN